MSAKLVGAFFLIAASLLAGAFASSCGKGKIAMLESLLELVTYIRTRISLYLTPVGEILASYKGELLEETGFVSVMRTAGLHAALSQVPCQLPAEAVESLERFACELGSSYSEHEIKRCDECISVLQRICDEEKEKLSKNRRLYLLLPPMCALSAIILLM